MDQQFCPGKRNGPVQLIKKSHISDVLKRTLLSQDMEKKERRKSIYSTCKERCQKKKKSACNLWENPV